MYIQLKFKLMSSSSCVVTRQYNEVVDGEAFIGKTLFELRKVEERSRNVAQRLGVCRHFAISSAGKHFPHRLPELRKLKCQIN